MATIIFNVTISDGANELISSLKDLCTSREICFDVIEPAPDACIIIGNKPATGQQASQSDYPEEDMPALAVAAGCEDDVSSHDEPVQIEPASVAQPLEIVQVAANPLGEVVVLSLSTLCAIPSVYSPTEQSSKLLVNNVSYRPDHVAFEYCGSFFKFPLNTALDQDCINTVQQADVSKIRIVVKFTGSNTIYPIAVEVCEKSQDDPYLMVFGQDLEELKSEMEAYENVNLPA